MFKPLLAREGRMQLGRESASWAGSHLYCGERGSLICMRGFRVRNGRTRI